MQETQEFQAPSLFKPSYMSIVFSPGTSANDLSFYFEEDSFVHYKDLASTSDSYLRWVIDDFQPFVGIVERPWILVHGDYLGLKDWVPRPEDMRRIREKGLAVFLFEPVTFYDNTENRAYAQKEDTRCFELEKLAKFADEHGITSRITVYLCENGLDRVLAKSKRYSKLALKSFSSYLLKSISDCSHFPPLPQRKITKKFMCLNFRYEPIREMMVGYFAARGYLDDSYISFYHSHNMEEFYKNMPLTPESIPEYPTIMEGVRRMQKYLPLSLESHNPLAVDPAVANVPDLDGAHNITNTHWLFTDYVPQTFVFTYCESRPFSPRSEISEKTIHPIYAKKPFLPFAGQYFLAGMRELGFKTFGEFWDESFDECPNPERRFSLVLKTIDSLARLSISEIRDIHSRIEPILEHNHNWMCRYLIPQKRKALLETHDRTM